MWDELREFWVMKYLTACLVVSSILMMGCGSKESSKLEEKQKATPNKADIAKTNSEPISKSLAEVALNPSAVESEKAIDPEPIETKSSPELVTENNRQVADEERITDEPIAVTPKPEIKLSEDISKPASAPSSAASSIRSSQRERFEEESRLELKEDRWYVIGESKPFTGRVKRWVVEGWKQAEGSYSNGLQDGRWKMWWDNGLLRSAVYMKNGNPNGEAIYWYKNGQRKEEGSWSSGNFTATAKWSEAGEEILVK